jgi:hypothetical protein
MSGIGVSGYASWYRMIIISTKPKRRNNSPVTAYWMPMTLWSSEKRYFLKKPGPAVVRLLPLVR